MPPVHRPLAAVAAELAQLETLRHLTLGAAHTLNNALTSILGETSFLLDERKQDADVREACEQIQQEVERCARLTRALLSRRGERPADSASADAVRMLRELEPLLRDTLSRSVALAVELPDDPCWVRGARSDLEELVLIAVQRLVRLSPCGGALHLGLETDGGERVISLRFEAVRSVEPGSHPLDGADQPWDAVVLDATAALAASHGARLEAERAESAIHFRIALEPG